MATKPPCGCCRKNFEFISFEHTGDGLYRLVFNACNVNPLILQVSQDCTIWFADTIVPTSGVIEGVNLNGVPDGVYTAKGSSPNCDGYAEFEFRVVHNGTIPASEYELEAPELSATSISATSIRVGWTHEGLIDDYKLQILDAGAWSDLATIPASSRAYDISELEEGTEVSVRIGARKGTNILWSNLAKATPMASSESETPTIIEDFVFLTNTTGYFDSDDFISKIRGLALASNEIRWCVRWDEYETAPGVYATEKLANRMAQIDAIYVAKGRNRPRYSIDFWGVRHDGKIEQFIPSDDIVVFQGGKRAVGDLVVNKCYGLGSFSSVAYKNRINSCAYSIVKWFAENAPGRMNYISLSCGQTEEFFNYLWDDPERPNNYESHGDFSPTAVAAWRKYLLDTYGGTTPWGESSSGSNIPTATWDADGVWGVAYMVATQKGTAWSKFTNLEMEKVVIGFRNAAKSANSNVRVIHFVADFYRAQSNGWYGNSPSNYPIIAQLDGFYHSDGDMGADGDFSKKYSAFDCLVPTFGANKHYYCELDYVDMYMFRMDEGHWGEVSTTVMPDKNAIKRVCRSVFRKGGRGIHFAMSMTEAQAEVAAEACLEFLEEVRSGTITRLDRASAPNFTFDLAPMVFGQGENLLNFYKSTAGGTEENVVNVHLVKNY